MPRKKYTLDDYDVLQNGTIFSKKTKVFLKPRPNNKGYLRVCIGKKMMFVHRLVAEKYVPNPDGKEQVNHIDGNKQNNNANNLEWVTNRENKDHAMEFGLLPKGDVCPWSKLSKEDVLYIREHDEISDAEFASMFGVSSWTVKDARQGITWKSVEKIC